MDEYEVRLRVLHIAVERAESLRVQTGEILNHNDILASALSYWTWVKYGSVLFDEARQAASKGD